MLGVVVMFKVISSWVDRKLEVTPGMGLPLVALALAVSLQWLVFFLQVFCQPWLRTTLAQLFR